MKNKGNKDSLRNFWDNSKHINIRIIESQEKKKRRRDMRKCFRF